MWEHAKIFIQNTFSANLNHFYKLTHRHLVFSERLNGFRKVKQIITDTPSLKISLSANYKPVDFCRGPSELIDAINNNKESLVSAEIGVHVNEIIEVLQYPQKFNGYKKIISSLRSETFRAKN